jgi:hypothetical protein
MALAEKENMSGRSFSIVGILALGTILCGDPQSTPRTETQPRPTTESESQSRAETQPRPIPTPQLQPRVESQPRAMPQPQPRTEAQ